MGMEQAENSMARRRQIEEEHTPVWIKIFGGSILSICFLSVLTLTGYIVSNINNIQSQVNIANADMLTKKEFIEREKTIWDSIKLDLDAIAAMKERITAIEQFGKERQLWMEKYETKITDISKIIDSGNKEVAALKEKANNSELQLMQLRELQKDLQNLRERLIAIEGKFAEKKKE